MIFDKIYTVERSLVEQVKWQGDPHAYDQQLFELGKKKSKFLIFNPSFSDDRLKHYITSIPEGDQSILWEYENMWFAKLFKSSYREDPQFKIVQITKPKFTWKKNQDLDRLMKFENDPFAKFEPEAWDSMYKLVWYMDPRFNPLEEKVWAISCEPLGSKHAGIKDMGYLTPLVNIEINPELEQLDIDLDQYFPAYYDLADTNVWKLNPIHTRGQEDMWVFKFSPAYRRPRFEVWYGQVDLDFTVEYNPRLPDLNFEIDTAIPWHDLYYEHMWMLDHKHLQNGEENIWALKVSCVSEPLGTKIAGYTSPSLTTVDYNPDLPQLNYNIEYIVPWHDFEYEHMWMLDQKHLQNGEEDIWTVRVSYVESPVGTKTVGYVSPEYTVEYNPNLPPLNYNIEYVVPWYDLKFDHVWYLDPIHLQNNENEMWAFGITFSTLSEGIKNMGHVSPCIEIEYNTDLPDLKFDLEYALPWYDLKYDHVWYLDNNFSPNPEEKIWVVTVKSTPEPVGLREMGTITPLIESQLDVIFISYFEPNAEENWKRVLEKAPWAKRINGVKGIFEAHKAAAKLASSDMFYVVDGDAWLVDDWQFDYQPGIFDRDCAYVWHSLNPLTQIEYGYGGVKLFSKKQMLTAKSMTKLDMTTSVMKKLKIMPKVSTETRFNVDEFSAWRSAFRECVKLYYNTQQYPDQLEHQERLAKWVNIKSGDFKEAAQSGARAAIAYAQKNLKKYNLLLKINDRDWLEAEFRK